MLEQGWQQELEQEQEQEQGQGKHSSQSQGCISCANINCAKP